MVRPVNASVNLSPFCTFQPKVAEEDVKSKNDSIETNIPQFSWLSKDAKTPLADSFNFQLFSLESCDPFIGNTKLEGASFSETIDRFFDCLKRSDHKAAAFPVTDLQEALVWSREMDKICMAKTNEGMMRQLKEVSQEMLDRVTQLKVGEKVVIPGGVDCRQQGRTCTFLCDYQNK